MQEGQLPASSIFKDEDLENIAETLRFEADGIIRQLNYDLVMMFLIYKYSDQMHLEYLKNNEEDISYSNSGLEIARNSGQYSSSLRKAANFQMNPNISKEKMKSKEYYVYLMCKMYIRRLQVYLACFSYMFCASRIPPQLKNFLLSHDAHHDHEIASPDLEKSPNKKKQEHTSHKSPPTDADESPTKPTAWSKRQKVVLYKLCRIRRHIYKPMFHQIKEYLVQILSFLIPQLEAMLATMKAKPPPRKGGGVDRSFQSRQPEPMSHYFLEQYGELVIDLKALYGLNRQFLQKHDDISLPVRISLLHTAHELSEYHDQLNYIVTRKKNKIRKDMREQVLLYDAY